MIKKTLLILTVAVLAGWLVVIYGLPENPQPLVQADVSYSNIHAGDYVGPEACAKCHTEQHDDWMTHPHSTMNQDATDKTVVGDFSARTVNYGDGQIVFDKQDDRFLMSLFQNGEPSRQYRVTRTVGSRFTQMYIGLQVSGPEPEDHQVYRIEGKLPFGYWIGRDLWTPVSYFDSAYEEEPVGLSEKTEMLGHSQKAIKWEVNCLYCHNTYPYQHRMFFGSVLGLPREDFQFPEGMQTLEKWGALTPDKVVTLGVSCESCHYGGREHAENGKEIRNYPTSPELIVTEVSTDQPSDHATAVNSICRQCHCAKVDLFPNGAATWNSREALDLQSGACEQQIACTDCHNPHRPGPEGGLFSDTRIITTCLNCHQQFKDELNLLSHTRHAADSTNCLDCHMPRIVQGLDSVIRTHHICSPTDESMLKLAGPNACNLCHLDRTIQWTAAELNKGWGVAIHPDSNWSEDYGDKAESPVGKSWLDHTRPLMRLIAADAFAHSSENQTALPDLLDTLQDPYAVNRMFGLFAIEHVLERRLTNEEYDPLAAESDRNKMVDVLKAQLTPATEADSN